MMKGLFFATIVLAVAEGGALFGLIVALGFLGWFFVFGLRAKVRELSEKIAELESEIKLRELITNRIEPDLFDHNIRRLQKAIQGRKTIPPYKPRAGDLLGNDAPPQPIAGIKEILDDIYGTDNNCVYCENRVDTMGLCFDCLKKLKS